MPAFFASGSPPATSHWQLAAGALLLRRRPRRRRNAAAILGDGGGRAASIGRVLHLRACAEHDDGLAVRGQQALLLEHLEHPSGHLTRTTDQARQLLAADLDLHALRMRHRIRFAAEVHDRVGDATGDIDEREIAELAVRAVEARGQLRCKLEHESGALGGQLAEAGVGHFRELALLAGAHPGTAGGLFVEQAHLAEELALVEVRQHHLVAFLVLDHDFDRAVHDVVEDVGQVAGVDDDRLRRHGADSAVAQEPVDGRYVA